MTTVFKQSKLTENACRFLSKSKNFQEWHFFSFTNKHYKWKSNEKLFNQKQLPTPKLFQLQLTSSISLRSEQIAWSKRPKFALIRNFPPQKHIPNIPSGEKAQPDRPTEAWMQTNANLMNFVCGRGSARGLVRSYSNSLNRVHFINGGLLAACSPKHRIELYSGGQNLAELPCSCFDTFATLEKMSDCGFCHPLGNSSSSFGWSNLIKLWFWVMSKSCCRKRNKKHRRSQIPTDDKAVCVFELSLGQGSHLSCRTNKKEWLKCGKNSIEWLFEWRSYCSAGSDWIWLE